MPVLVAYLAAFVLTAVASVTLVFCVALARSSRHPSELQSEATAFAFSAPGLMAGAAAGAAVLASVALAAARLQGPRVLARLHLGPTRASPLGTLAVTAGLLGLSTAGGTVADWLGLRGGGMMDEMARALQAPPPARFIAALLAIGVAPGLAEETFFRGFMQPGLVASWGRWPAIVAAAAAFGLIHLDRVQGPVAFVAGLFLGWAVERLGGIRPSILAHVANNAIFLAAAALGSSVQFGPAAQAAGAAGGLLACAGSIAILRSSRAVRA